MSVKNCPICGRIYEYVSGPDMCRNCYNDENEIFKVIKGFLEIHPGANVMEVSIALDISVDKITHFLKEGRLELVEGDSEFLKCERCDKSIRSGRYCDVCLKGVKQEFSKVINAYNAPVPKIKVDEKMRYLGKNK